MGVKAKSMNYEAEAPEREINILTSVTVNGREYPVPDHLQDCREIELDGYVLDLDTGVFVADPKPLPYFWIVSLLIVAIILSYNATR